MDQQTVISRCSKTRPPAFSQRGCRYFQQPSGYKFPIFVRISGYHRNFRKTKDTLNLVSSLSKRSNLSHPTQFFFRTRTFIFTSRLDANCYRLVRVYKIWHVYVSLDYFVKTNIYQKIRNPSPLPGRFSGESDVFELP